MSPRAPVPLRTRSRVVAWAKVLLPLAALALLSTVFLFARGPRGPVEIPYAQLEEIARDPRLDRPRLAGVAPDGTAVALSATQARMVPGRAGAYLLDAPRLETEGEDGTATLEAARGEVDAGARTLRLTGAVRLATSAGVTVETEEATADLSAGTATMGAVAATAPLGEIAAGALDLTSGEGGQRRLLFHGGVRVLYHPGGRTGGDPP